MPSMDCSVLYVIRGSLGPHESTPIPPTNPIPVTKWHLSRFHCFYRDHGYSTHTHTHARTHTLTDTHARTHARTHTHTHICSRSPHL